MPCRRREGNFPGHGPHQGHQGSRNRHHDVVGVLAASDEWSRPLAQADLRLPTEIWEGFGPLCQSPLEMATDLGRVAVRPRAFNQGPAGMAMAGLGDASLGTPWATGRCRGRQTQITHPRCGVGQARQVAACGDGRDGHGARYTPQRLEGLHDWGEAPRVAPRLECLCQTREAFGGFGDRPPILLEDDRVGGRRTDDGREPSERCGAPRAWPVERMSWRRRKAFRRDFAALRSWMLSARARLRSRMASSSTWGTSTRGRSPERISRARGRASRRSVVTRSPAFFGIHEGATTQQSCPLVIRWRSSQSPHGPAS